MKLYINFARAVTEFICHALVFTRRVIGVNSDGIKMVDIMSWRKRLRR